MNEELKKLFYNVETGLTSENKLYKKAKEMGLNITHKQIKEFLDNQFVNQVYKQDKRPKYFSSITEDKIRDNYQIDIMVYDRYEFHKYKYILVLVDIYSRYAMAEALTNREFPTIMKALLKIFKSMGLPKKISCDNEFSTNAFKDFCADNKITLELSEPNDIQKNSIVERLNRTIAGYFQKLRIGNKVYNWPSNLNNIMINYNHSYHRTIRNTPENIFNNGEKNKQDIIIVPRNFKVGDKVRLKIKKETFNKGDVLTYSKHIYTIVKIENNKYLLDDNKFYTANKLMKNPIIEENDINNSDEENEHINNQKEKKHNKVLKAVGIDTNNIVEGKRNRTPKKFD